jgi:predicted GNAT family acetyltransferase
MNNLHEHRFETNVDGHVAVLNYRQVGRSITLLHTEVPQELAGRGVGSALAKAGLKYAHEQGLRVIPKCEFVASYLEKHPELAHLLGSGSQRPHGF